MSGPLARVTTEHLFSCPHVAGEAGSLCVHGAAVGPAGTGWIMGQRRDRQILHVAGFQPGGGPRRSGVALLETDGGGGGRAQLDTVRSVDAALDWLRSHLDGADLDGLGVGAPLAWATGQGGLRSMDHWIRARHRRAGQGLRSPHVATGAILVQGAALATLCRRIWPRAWLNETQPEALWRWLAPGADREAWLRGRFLPALDLSFGSEREGLALLSAWATFMGLSGRWPRDLAAADETLVLPAGQVHLFWPEPAPSD
jgi:hypothetical protein